VYFKFFLTVLKIIFVIHIVAKPRNDNGRARGRGGGGADERARGVGNGVVGEALVRKGTEMYLPHPSPGLPDDPAPIPPPDSTTRHDTRILYV